MTCTVYIIYTVQLCALYKYIVHVCTYMYMYIVYQVTMYNYAMYMHPLLCAGPKKTTPTHTQPAAPKPKPKEPSGPAPFNPDDILKHKLSNRKGPKPPVDLPPPPPPAEPDWVPKRYLQKGWKHFTL